MSIPLVLGLDFGTSTTAAAWVDGNGSIRLVRVSESAHSGSFCALSQTSAQMRSGDALPELADLRIEILDDSGAAFPGAFYAKVVRAAPGLEGVCVVRFTSRSPALERILATALGVS